MSELQNELLSAAEGEPLSEPISDNVAQSLASALAKIETYVPTVWVDNSEPDIDAEHLNHAEQAIMKVTDLLNGAVDVIQDLQAQVAQNVTDIGSLNNKLDTPLSTSILEKALTLKSGLYHFKLDGSTYSGGDLPDGMYAYGSALVTVRDPEKSITVMLLGVGNYHLAINYYSQTKWLGWNVYVTNSDIPGAFSEQFRMPSDTSNQDYNELTAPGIFPQLLKVTAPNGPGFWAYLMVFAYHTGGNVTQVAFGYNSREISIRYRFQNAWVEWVKK